MSLERVEERLRAHLAGRGPGTISAYLFGSVAEGRAHRESDVDVGMLLDRAVFPSAADRMDARITLGSELVDVLDTNDVDLVILNDAPPELGRAIVTRGRRVHCADAEADHAYVRDVQLRAADLAPHLNTVTEWRTAEPARPRDFTGSFFSEELDATWEIVARDEGLVLRRWGIPVEQSAPGRGVRTEESLTRS